MNEERDPYGLERIAALVRDLKRPVTRVKVDESAWERDGTPLLADEAPDLVMCHDCGDMISEQHTQEVTIDTLHFCPECSVRRQISGGTQGENEVEDLRREIAYRIVEGLAQKKWYIERYLSFDWLCYCRYCNASARASTSSGARLKILHQTDCPKEAIERLFAS